jgi:EAL domain-containing protein (putative c-di-GMP-specific phosphodiesterase class I)
MVSPGQFIPLAEQAGLIQPMTEWALDTAVAECARWRMGGLPAHVAINLSVRNLQDPSLPDKVRGCLDRWQAEPSWFTLEVTESMLMTDTARTMETVTRLSQMGLSMSIDDFGTGYSSLAYLKRLPVRELKIDRSFVVDMARDDQDATVVRSIVELAHNLALDVVAEGVEDEDILDQLIALGCDLAQGYYLGRPMPAEDLAEWAVGDIAARFSTPAARRRLRAL